MNTDLQEAYAWTGSDDFDELKDRKDLPPLPLPLVEGLQNLVLVRHGQSTWNKAARIQGSSNVSQLSPKGIIQAEAARDKLAGEHFDALFSSPLQRSAKTAEIIWAGREGAAQVLPSLREVDLYSFQGLLKAEGKAKHGEQYRAWQQEPAAFEIDGHAPVRELWYRASLALKHMLSQRLPPPQTAAASASDAVQRSTSLVVAHNAVNQAVLCVALGLPPSRFRMLVQCNAATSWLRFQRDGNASQAVLHHLNQSPDVLTEIMAGEPTAERLRIVIVTAGSLSAEAASATAAVLLPLQVQQLVCDDDLAARGLVSAIAGRRGEDEGEVPLPPPHLWSPLRGSDADLQTSPLLQQQLTAALLQFCSQAMQQQGNASGATVAVVTTSDRSAAIMQTLLKTPDKAQWTVELQPGGISVVDVTVDAACTDSQDDTVHCMNNRAHIMDC